jgi:hypothetical protein
VELSALSLLKLPEGLEVQLDVGAVLYPQYDHGGGKVYEMFGGSRIRLREGSVLEQWLLHHREITGLRGGQYRLAGFIRNVGSGTFGGAEAIVTLPKAGDPALVGPFLYQSERPYFRSELPLLGKTGHTQASGIAASRGSLPAPPVLSQGSKVLFITWSCGALDRPVDLDQERIVRHIMKEGETLDALAAPHFIEAEENCLKVVDSLDTSRLPEGSFSYLVLKELDDGSPALSSQVAFEITAAR